MSVPKSWLWPDHAISKQESRALREEHNALVNAHAGLLEACEQAEHWLSEEAASPQPGQTKPEEILRVLRAAIAAFKQQPFRDET